MEMARQRTWLSWSVVGVLAVLCGFLAFLQNTWIDELSRAERERLQQELQSELNHLSDDFNNAITSACSGLLPPPSQIDQLGRERAYALQYSQWKESHDRVFSKIALAVPQDGSLLLFNLNLDTDHFQLQNWPPGWGGMHDRLLARARGAMFGPGPDWSRDPTLIDMPRFSGQGGPDRGGEQEWLLADLNLEYVRSAMLPALLRQHLGGRGKPDYQAEVIASADPANVIFQSGSKTDSGIIRSPDASVGLFDLNYAAIWRHTGDQPARRPPPPHGQGRWRLLIWHPAGSLDAIVSRARWQNLGVSAGILLLILASIVTLVSLSRRAQRLAEQQMNFVAGVSHELRTPLTVIRTAAFNLRGKLNTKPDQVERYGELIQRESEKLGAIVEQILRFASTRAGHVIRQRQPVSIEAVIEEGIRSSQATLGKSHVVVERKVERELPLVLADDLALKHVVQNLVDNAFKYGTEGSHWIGVFASAVTAENESVVEIRIADRGPGIPVNEQSHIFDAFFRGRRAVEDQVHGTGLGLNLVKKIVEAHGGTIRVESEPMKGTEFIVRIPVASQELQDEFAHSTH